jgi:hypothetical protein
VWPQQDEPARLARWNAWIGDVAKRAKAGLESGRSFYVERFNLGGTTAGLMSQSQGESDDIAGALQAIEGVGWRLDHIGYVYQPLRERSHLLTDSSLMTGNIVGIYTFRRSSGSPTDTKAVPPDDVV